MSYVVGKCSSSMRIKKIHHYALQKVAVYKIDLVFNKLRVIRLINISTNA